MKKVINLILAIIMSIIVCFCLCSCSNEQIVNNRFGERFGVVERLSDWAIIIYDKETKVEYLWYEENHRAGLTVMVDENGKPLLYQGDERNDKR